MNRETARQLLDVQRPAQEVMQFVEGKTIDDMWADRGLQLSLHKLLEMIGEGLHRLEHANDPEGVGAISNVRRFVDLRNRITHGYDSVDYGIVWQVSTERVPELLRDIDRAMLNAPLPDEDAP